MPSGRFLPRDALIRISSPGSGREPNVIAEMVLLRYSHVLTLLDLWRSRKRLSVHGICVHMVLLVFFPWGRGGDGGGAGAKLDENLPSTVALFSWTAVRCYFTIFVRARVVSDVKHFGVNRMNGFE